MHIEAYIERIAVCGGIIALALAAMAGVTDMGSIVAVTETGSIVAPCGMCRELVSDYSSLASFLL